MDSKYTANGLEETLSSILGDQYLSDLSPNVDVLIPTYSIDRRDPVFFKSWKARGEKLGKGDTASKNDFKLVDVGRATSAAPTYFQPCQIYNKNGDEYACVDGGVFANNPSACALAEVRRLCPNAAGIWMLSLGTGLLERPYPYKEAKDWGLPQWISPLIDVMLDGVSESTTYQVKHLLCGDDDKFIRVQVSLKNPNGPNDDMDDVSDSNIHKLRERAQEAIPSDELQEAVHYLKKSGS